MEEYTKQLINMALVDIQRENASRDQFIEAKVIHFLPDHREYILADINPY